MKTLKTLLLVLAITFTSVLSANSNPTEVVPTELTKEITSLLLKPKFKIAGDLSAKVTFTLNKDNEIVVLDVDTNSITLERYIKNRLNYTKLSLKLKNENQVYEIPVRVVVK